MDELSDDELVGVLRGPPGGVLAGRAGAGGPPAADRAAAELAAALTLTGRAAGRLLATAEGLEPLPAVRDGLARGEIDLPRAQVFADELAGLDWLRGQPHRRRPDAHSTRAAPLPAPAPAAATSTPMSETSPG